MNFLEGVLANEAQDLPVFGREEVLAEIGEKRGPDDLSNRGLVIGSDVEVMRSKRLWSEPKTAVMATSATPLARSELR